jgi:sucrose-6-phosphatase
MATELGPRGVRLFAADLDGTLIGDAYAAERFTATWQVLPATARPLLVYNTGRTVVDTERLIRARQLPKPGYIVGSIGTELAAPTETLRADFAQRFGSAWNLAEVEALVRALPGVRPQPPEFGHRFKSSWYWLGASRAAVEGLRQRLHGAGLDAQVVYSARRFLDVVPGCAGKGNALAWLCARLGIALTEVLVAGDTGNDLAMFRLPGVRGIIVGNGLPELHRAANVRASWRARGELADGVLEGLRHFGVIAPDLAAG